MARFCARVRKRPDLPSVSMPDIYKHPTIRSLAAALANDVPTADPADKVSTALAECERRFAEVLADIVGTEHVSVDSHFFDDLGADSMLMARFCARVRKRPDLPSVSMPDIYKHPTIRSLAAALANTKTDTKPTPASQPATPAALIEPPRRARNGEYVLCGALQLLFLLGYPALTVVVAVKGYRVGLGRPEPGRHLPAVGRVRRRDVPRPVHPSDPAQVGAHRPVEAAADPGLEHGVLPLLARQDPAPHEPAGAVRRFTAVRALPEGAGREDRARRRHLLPERARVHRPAQHRRRRGDPEGLVLQRLPGPQRRHPDGRGQPRQGRAGRRGDGARHLDVAG